MAAMIEKIVALEIYPGNHLPIRILKLMRNFPAANSNRDCQYIMKYAQSLGETYRTRRRTSNTVDFENRQKARKSPKLMRIPPQSVLATES